MLNRVALYDALGRALADVDASAVGLLVLRAPRYREFAVRYGYAAADGLETAMRARIARTLRPVDVIHAMGEGGFAIVLPRLHGSNHAVLAATRLMSAFDEPLVLDTGAMALAIAIGIAVFPEHGLDADALASRAEAAYAEALRRSERFALYESHADALAVSEAGLRAAIDHNRLDVHLQPIRDAATGAVVGAESLARWRENGISIAPKVFVPLAEQTGLIGGLTHWSLNSTLRYAAMSRSAGLDLFFSINVSPYVLRRTDFVEQVLGALAIWDVPGDRLVLEVTETAIMEDPVRAAHTLARVRDHGVRVAIDDFGTGYSSFSYLRQLPATKLKIDISFITDLGADHRVAQLVRSMIDLAHHLDMTVVAEGVEDQATLIELREMGCDMVQGYHVGEPEPAQGLVERLAKSAVAAE